MQKPKRGGRGEGGGNVGTCTPELIALFFYNHLEYITVTLQSSPKQVLAIAKTNTIYNIFGFTSKMQN